MLVAAAKLRTRTELSRIWWVGWQRWRELLRTLGPGLVAGASDNDPTTVATMAVVGAKTGFALSWLVILIYPMLASVQAIASEVGITARSGLQELVRRRFGWRWGLLLLVSVLAVNLITLGADVEAGAAALGLILHRPQSWFVIPYSAVVLGIMLLGTYDEMERVLKYVLLIFLAYVAAAILARPNWWAVLSATIRPQLSSRPDYVEAALAVLGTTLTSYAYIWETQAQAEKERTPAQLKLARMEAGLGMLVAVGTFWFILVATGATLGARHQNVETAEQAAEALRPAAGPLAAYLFGTGLLASSLVAVPVLAATSSYLLCQQFGWQAGLSRRVSEARRFYLVIGMSLAIGAAISLGGIPTISLLFAASLAGGLGTPISMLFLMLVAQQPPDIGGYRISRALLAAGWGTTVVVTAASTIFLVQQIVH
jgi:Mn2+/Fe2+ NRAMP family transporter